MYDGTKRTRKSISGRMKDVGSKGPGISFNCPRLGPQTYSGRLIKGHELKRETEATR